MEKAGADLWSSTAVHVLKQQLDSELSRLWTTSLVGVSTQANGMTNGQVEPDEHNHSFDDQRKKHLLIQSLFDIFVLQAVLESSDPNPRSGLKFLEAQVESQIELEAASKTRLKQGGKEYWKRTSLLFGILA
jgi:hypothetical protein